MTNEPTHSSTELEACSSAGLVALLAASYEFECELKDDVMQLAMVGNSHFSESNESAASVFASIRRILEPAGNRYFMLDVFAVLKARLEKAEKVQTVRSIAEGVDHA